MILWNVTNNSVVNCNGHEEEMKIDKCFLLSMFGFWLSSAKDWNSVYLKQVKCVMPPEFYYQNFSCFAKSLNRTCSTATLVFESIHPLTMIYVKKIIFESARHQKLIFQAEFHLLYKYGTIYREVMNLKPIDVCNMMIVGTTNPLTKFIVDLANQTAPSFVHTCPYKVINITRAPIKTESVGSAFATGDYKISFIFKTTKQNFLCSLDFVLSINSSEKNSFG